MVLGGGIECKYGIHLSWQAGSFSPHLVLPHGYGVLSIN